MTPRIAVYLDNHATTRVDPRVVEAMLPFFGEVYGNPGSATHAFGMAARDAVEEARESIAANIGVQSKEIVFTGGATESNNLAIRGVAERHAARGRHIVSVATEHPAVLDPLAKLRSCGYEVTLLPVIPFDDPRAGLVDLDRLAASLRAGTILVSVMLANNEIGVIQPLAKISRLCKDRRILLHCDATQAIGKIPVDVEQLGVDLMSFTAHKIYGPKGVGALYVRSRGPRVRLETQIEGGGQENGLRSGTLNVPGIVGFAKALQLCIEEMPQEMPRLCRLRDRLFNALQNGLTGVTLNGPALDCPADNPCLRLPGNLNVSFAFVEGAAIMLHMPMVAVSSGSACTSAQPEPSHVLAALGMSDERVRGSLRFGLGRFTTEEEVDFVVANVTNAVNELRSMSSLASN
jgi:cysteine desulfurase